ncbi:MAG: valine--tRNA ligase [Bacilli bacterium]|nr:valine--tRNA ligase [Bacilli bacterium]
MEKLKDLPIKYDFKQVEQGKYDEWVKKGYFTAGDINKKPYTIVIPPPNITGKLHIGHVLDTTLQDIIIRRKRMMGFDTLYLPGMDHASIATQAKVEQKLRSEGIDKYSLGRDKFLEECWKWKEEHADIIHDQWKKLGLSLDYTRERFTLDKGCNDAINEVFVKMYNEGLIYRGEKIINWDIQAKTAISNIEVIYKDVEGAFYHFIYKFVERRDDDEIDGLEIATTRPETMFGDTAIMVHPEDERYKKYIGRYVYIPNTNIKIPVISDEYVEREFGTGVVKVTPAHDPNDFEVGLRHNLARPVCMNEDGTMNELAFEYQGMDRFECRKELVKKLQELGLCTKIEKMIHSVGHSERTGVVVEPRLSLQWFVKMEPLANQVLEMQKDEATKVNFVPSRFENIFNNWLTGIQDWCISRQLWWGHRIPAWYKDKEVDGKIVQEVYVSKNAPKGEGWYQDEDALDTWFSSALWPFSTLGWPNKTSDLERFYPGDTLVTGYDIIFFWVARMVFQSKYLNGVRPFKDVLIHGIIRDELGRKVSKSLGNGVDIYECFDKYGVDAVRYFLTTTGAPGQDLRYSDEKLESTWNYINKIWNISRYIGLQFDNFGYNNEKIDVSLLNTMDKWILSKLNKLIEEQDRNFEKYEFGEVAKAIYNFAWDDFASWYLEMTKVVFNDSNIDAKYKINTCSVLGYVLTAILKLLHPFMPFVTENIYQMFNEGSIVISTWPKVVKEYDFKDAVQTDSLFEIITTVRNIRAVKGVAGSKPITLVLQTKDEELIKYLKDNLHYLSRFTNYEKLEFVNDNYDTAKCSLTVLHNVNVIIPLNTLINIEEEKAKLISELAKMENEIKRCEDMLNNPNFVSKAPEKKINEEKEKLEKYKQKKEEINKLLLDL